MSDNNRFLSPVQGSNRKKPSIGINIGSSSILLIFVILCLVSFATLSLVSANADQRLTQKVLERTTDYYEACNQAQTALASIDATLSKVYESAESEEAYYETVGHSKSYAIPINEQQILHVSIEILYPLTDTGTYYRITSWQVITE